jgi:hypothetical protein
MAVADFAQEFFETPLMAAVVAARGIQGMLAGPVVGRHDGEPAAAGSRRRRQRRGLDRAREGRASAR